MLLQEPLDLLLLIPDGGLLDQHDILQEGVHATIHDLGAHVRVYDPVAMPKARRSYPQLEYTESAESAAREADILLLLTEWPEFRNLDPGLLGKTVAMRKIVDGRNTLVPEVWREAGWDYRALGRPVLTVAFAA